MPNDLHIPQFAGIHMAGVNSHRTALITLSGHPLNKSLKLTGLYEKIGFFGNLFSDDRLLEILRLKGPFDRVFVDCPISVPPCVACTRPICPGVDACEDVNVAYMMSLAQKINRKQKRRQRSLNPQVQRLFDVYRLSRGDPEHFEPTYSSNNATHAIRARSLQKRLSGMLPDIKLEETSVPLSLQRLAVHLGISESEIREYRSFSVGKKIRKEIFESLESLGWLRDLEEDSKSTVIHSVDVFEAFMTAFVAALVYSGIEEECPPDYATESEWVFRPQFRGELTSEEI